MARILKALLGLPFNWRQTRLARSRPSIGKSHFVESITASGGDEQAAVLVWEKLNEMKDIPSFTPYPSDQFTYVFGLADEDLDEDLILKSLDELAVPVPTPAQLSAFGVVDTPLRFAQLVAFCRRLTTGGSPDTQRPHND